MPKSRGMTGERWFECAMCGFDYPESQTAYWKGRRRCTVLCQDDTTNEEPEVRGISLSSPAGPGGRDGTNTP